MDPLPQGLTTPSRRRRRSLLLLGLLAGCARSTDRPLSAAALLAPLEELAPGITLRQWRAANPADVVLLDTLNTRPEIEPQWCAVASSGDSGTSTTVRRAYFAPPDFSAGAELPPVPDRGLAEAGCLLALVLVQHRLGDSAAAALLAGQAHDALIAGGGQASPDVLPLSEAVRWHERLFILQDSTVIVTAVRSDSARYHALAAAWLPTAHQAWQAVQDAATEEAEFWQEYWRAEAAAALQEAGTPPESFGALDAVRREVVAWARLRQVGQAAGLLPQDRLLTSLELWLTALRTVPSDQRSAGLYGADLVLEEAIYPYGLNQASDTVVTHRLGELGAGFLYVESAAEMAYGHSLLGAARAADSLSILSERTTLRLLHLGFDTLGTCGDGDQQFVPVIRVGDSLLAARPDGPRASLIHFLAAQAERDVVAIATGIEPQVGATPTVTAAAPAARIAAIAHYQAARGLELPSTLTRSFWPEAFRLAAGLRPRATRFWCIYD